MALINLSEELKNLANPEPIYDSDDEAYNDDSAKKIYNENTGNDKVDIPLFSSLKKKQVSSFLSSNKRYAGKKVSRDDFEEDVYNINEPSDDEESFEIKSDGNDSSDDYNENTNSCHNSSEISDEEDNDFPEIGKTDLNENDDSINILNVESEKQFSKATSVKNQLTIYDNLIETRLKMQSLLTSSNRLPRSQNYLQIRHSNSNLLNELINYSSKGIRKLSKVLLEIDSYLDLSENISPNNDNKRKYNFDNESLTKRFCSISENYQNIIDKWHERTKFANANHSLKKYNSFDMCPTKLIEQVLLDKERLVNRTRVKRSEYKIIGDVQEDNLDEDESNNFHDIFDDDDFYHQLLRQIIENKITEPEDSIIASRQYAEIQRLRNKLKKKVDTKASKGRKIRYEVHEKLVNFMAPVDMTTMEDEARNELFKSLFGNIVSNN